jgi:hypothetical protein
MTRPCAISTALAPDRRRTAGSRHVPGPLSRSCGRSSRGLGPGLSFVAAPAPEEDPLFCRDGRARWSPAAVAQQAAAGFPDASTAPPGCALPRSGHPRSRAPGRSAGRKSGIPPAPGSGRKPCLASATCSRHFPAVEIGKNNSGSTNWHAAMTRQFFPAACRRPTRSCPEGPPLTSPLHRLAGTPPCLSPLAHSRIAAVLV